MKKSPLVLWNSLILKEMAKGYSKPQAVRRVTASHPALWQRCTAIANRDGNADATLATIASHDDDTEPGDPSTAPTRKAKPKKKRGGNGDDVDDGSADYEEDDDEEEDDEPAPAKKKPKAPPVSNIMIGRRGYDVRTGEHVWM